MDTGMGTLSTASESEGEGEEPSSSSSSTPVGGGIHPLLINHILDIIFSSPDLEEQELLSFRKVCKSWNFSATKEFRKRGTPYTFYEPYNVKGFMDLMENTQIVPLTKFMFLEEFFMCENSNIILHFLGRWGPYLEQLHLSFAMSLQVTSYYGSFSLGIFNYTEDFEQHFHFPKLRSLTLDFSFQLNTVPVVSVRTLCSLVQLVLKKSSNIDDLSVWIMVDRESRENIKGEIIQEVYPVIISSMSMGKNLKRLVIAMSEIKDEHVVLLRDNLMNDRVALKELALILSNREFDLEHGVGLSTLISLLEHQKDSLIELRTTSTTHSLNQNNAPLPIFPKLERLTIRDGGEDDLKMVNMKFLESFPALKVLDMKEVANEIQDHAQPKDPSALLPKTIPPLEKLAIHGPSEVMVNTYARLFPNVRSLVFCHDTNDFENEGETLRVVFSKMRQLEELFLDSTEFLDMDETNRTTLDSLLTGIPKEECKIILETGDFERNIEGDIAPGLLNLTNLKKIVILVRGETRGIQWTNYENENFSDVTARLALLKMPKLKNCVLYGSSITTECLDLLRAKLNKFTHNENKDLCYAYFLGMCNMQDCRH